MNFRLLGRVNFPASIPSVLRSAILFPIPQEPERKPEENETLNTDQAMD